MPTFYYRAKNKLAETVNGQILAQNRNEAVEKINLLGLIPVNIAEDGERSATTLSQNLSVRLNVREISIFSRQLASLLKTGISLLRALEILEKQKTNFNFRSVIRQIIGGIRDGKSLADCFSAYPRIFSSFYVAMIHSGEESGQLREMLLSMSDYLRNQDEIMSKVRTAFVYPLIMLSLGFVTVVFLLTFVMPRITNLFVDLHQTLPLPTLILMNTSEWLKNNWWLFLLLVGIVALFMKRWLGTPAGHLILSRFKLQLPFLGPLLLKVELARFCRSMELLFKSGVAILRALKLSTPMIENDVMRLELERCHADLVQGNSLGRSLKQAQHVPAMISDMVAIGEESGGLSTTLHDIAEDYERDIQETIRVMLTLLEPMMIILVGSVIGFMVVAMLLPIFQLDIYSR